MRPRFKLTRLIVVAFSLAVVSLCLFALLAYPTNRSRRLLAEFKSGQRFPYAFHQLPTHAAEVPTDPVGTFTTKLLPQTWDDLFNLQRRIAVTTNWSDKDNPKLHARDEAEIVITINTYGMTGTRYPD